MQGPDHMDGRSFHRYFYVGATVALWIAVVEIFAWRPWSLLGATLLAVPLFMTLRKRIILYGCAVLGLGALAAFFSISVPPDPTGFKDFGFFLFGAVLIIPSIVGFLLAFIMRLSEKE